MTEETTPVSPRPPRTEEEKASRVDSHNDSNEKPDAETETIEVVASETPPSMTTALLLYWVLPVYWLAVYSHFSNEESDPDTETSYTSMALIAYYLTLPVVVLALMYRYTSDASTPKATQAEPDPSEEASSTPPSMMKALFLYWILPVMLLAIFSRYTVDTSDPFPGIETKYQQKLGGQKQGQQLQPQVASSKAPPPSQSPTAPKKHKQPTNYQDIVNQVKKRRRKIHMASSPSVTATERSQAPKAEAATSTDSPSSQATSSATSSKDAQRVLFDQRIEQLRLDYNAKPNDVEKALVFADALRHKDVIYHDGGTGQMEALETYQRALDMTLLKRKAMIEAGKPTKLSLSGTTSVQEELMFDYTQKSVDGLLCSIYTNMGKQYFMANMFEKAVQAYSQCIDLEPLYLDAVGSRGSSQIILGRYDDAGRDLAFVVEHDQHRFFHDAFTGLAKVLTVKEEAVPGGWDPMVSILDEMIPELEGRHALAPENVRQALAETLSRVHHVMFTYHDVKTNDTRAAWDHLTQGYKHKMSALAPFNSQFERQKLLTVTQIFQKGFWPQGVGSPTRVPIFIIGFVRSGSTLLERVLDAHPLIVGTGEDSVFNGRLDHIRNSIVEASMTGSTEELQSTVRTLADDVVDGMRKRWEVIDANTEKPDDEKDICAEPERFADKMLTNYNNIGFIHMLFPNALILHVAREPMDTIFSAYKHEFPPGTLDYTSEFSSLAHLYHGYRDIMEHWDKVLPGRVTHVRYEDMVHDMPGMAKAIISATQLPWDEDVLQFHKKKHAVNTLSTTQVRKGVYKDSLQSWKRYKEQLQPLVELLEDRVEWDLKTSLSSYIPVPSEAAAVDTK